MKSFKDKNVQDKKVDYNSGRLSYLTSKTYFKICNHVGQQATNFKNFLKHHSKPDFNIFNLLTTNVPII